MSYPSLKITFLGTGTSSGVPMIGCKCKVCISADHKDKRLRSSILIQSLQTTIVIDTTPDFRYQMLRENVFPLNAVLFTHPHKDHIAGLDDIRAYNYFTKKSMDVYANTMTQTALKNEFGYAFAKEKYPGLPNINLLTIENEPFKVGDIPVIPITVHHLHMPVLGFRFGNFTYITDANKIDEEEKKKIIGSDIVVLNALRIEEHLSHFSLQEATEMIKELQVPKAYFTHISHQLGKHEEVNNTLPNHMQLAWDRLSFII